MNSCDADRLQRLRAGIHQKTLLVFAGRLAHFKDADFGRTNMQPRTRRLIHFLKSWVINTFAVLVAVQVVHGIHFRDAGLLPPVITALVLGILNAFIRPILMLIALPLLIFTLGLFTFVINALLLCLVSWLMRGYFQVDTFGSAFLGALVISIVSIALNFMTGGGRVTVQRHRPPPPKKSGDDDDKPVIDV
jgi:putative membrane protein